MRVEQEKVRAFMEKIGDDVNDHPVCVEPMVGHRRYRLIKEELKEYRDANDAGDIVKVADALGDLLYTVLGAGNLHGIDLHAIFDEVHRSNMTKEPNTADLFKKAFKGPKFQKPRIADVLLAQSLNVDK